MRRSRRCPGAVALGSWTDSAASPAVLVTVAASVGGVVAATPGVSGPKAARGDRLSASVAGTVPATAPSTLVASTVAARKR